MPFGGPAEVLELVQAERPVLAIDKDKIEVELPQNVDDPRGWEGKVVAVRFASGTHGGFDPVGLLHRMSSCLRRPRSGRSIGSGRTLHQEKRVLQEEQQSAEWATASIVAYESSYQGTVGERHAFSTSR